MAVVVFDVTSFRELYSQFSTLSDVQLEDFFNIATHIIIGGNKDNSRIPYNPPKETERETLLYMLVCHLATLAQRPNGLVGILNSAAEGSVNATFTVPQIPKADWFLQTPCGFMYWQMISPYVLGGIYYGSICKH